MQKAYNRINWENYPSDRTPINETNLNKLDVGVNEIDNRIISLDSTKLDKTEASQLVKNIELDEATGIFTITYLSGATATIDTMLEKVVVNFDYDETNQKLVFTLDDGTVKEVDLKALITEYEFEATDTVAFFVDTNGKISANVKDGSIQEQHLRPNYLADIRVESAKAEASAVASDASAIASENSAVRAESWTVGGTGTRTDEDTDNAKYYYEASKQIYNEFENVGAVVGVKGDAETDYRAGFVNITAENIGLGNVDNTADADKNVKHAESANNATNDSEGRNIADALNKFSLSNGRTAIYSEDLNNINYNSIYNVNGTTDKNAPYNEWGFVITFVHNYATSHISQIWVGMTYNKIYYRYKTGSWIGWQEMASMIDVANYALKSEKINATVDFNDFKTSGVYHISSPTASNRPTDCHGTLIVEYDVGTPYQLWLPDYLYVIYKRTSPDYGHTWGTWTEMDAGTANSAINDSEGRNIADTYATKEFALDNFNRLGLNEADIDTKRGNWSTGISSGITPDGGWGNIIQFDCDHFITQLGIGCDGNGAVSNIYYRNKYTSGNWSNWSKISKTSDILNTATAIEASTSDDNIVGAKGLKEYINATKPKTVTSNDASIFIDLSQYSIHALVQISIKEKVQGSCLVSLNKSSGLWYINKIGGDESISLGNISANGVQILSNTAKNTITYTIISGV